MIYQYLAYNATGETINGRLSATSEEAATNLLDYVGYRVINLKPFVPFFSADKLLTGLVKVKTTDIILLYRQLALLLESGIDIVTSLDLLQNQIADRVLRKVLREIGNDVRSGDPLSAALGKHQKIFPPIHCRSLSIAEQSGGLEVVLRYLADHVEKEITTNKSIKDALMYPIIVSVVATLVIGVIVTFVLPAFNNLYSSVGASLPPLTRLAINVAGLVRSNVVFIMLALSVITGLTLFYAKTPAGKLKLDGLTLKLPLLGRVNHLNILARFCRNISLLFRAGLPLTEIMPLIIQSSDNKVMTKALVDINEEMLQGKGLYRPMAKNPLFLPMMVQMIKIGEETGNLDTTLLAVAQGFEAEAEDRVRSLIKLIQPTMTLVIALVIAGIALSMVSAMYSIYGQDF